jgi:hypothetical protein
LAFSSFFAIFLKKKRLPGRIMKFPLSLFFLSIAFLFFSGCKPMPNDGVPFYLRIDSVAVEGNRTHQILDVWAEANSTDLGAYELPCNFPVLEENEVRMTLSAGIAESGQMGVRVNYPFYLPDTFTLNAVRANQYSRSPVFRYRASSIFAFDENFESGNGFNDLQRLTGDSNVVQGIACGKLSVSSLDSASEAKQITPYDLPEGTEIWLEVDYKSEVPFYAGYYANFSGTSVRVPVLFLTQSSTWNKVYIKLSNLIGATRANTYQVYFEALRPYGSGGGSVYIDNVRMVHF